MGVLYAIAVSLFAAVISGYQIAFAFTILSLLITPLGAAIVLLFLSAILLHISAEVSLKDSPCAKAVFQGLAGAMVGLLPWGAAARLAAIVDAISISSLSGALGGGGVGIALGLGGCSL